MLNLFDNLQYPGFKLMILALLTLNFIIYAFFDTWIKAVDALVWLALLVLYKPEANHLVAQWQSSLNKLRTVLVILVLMVFFNESRVNPKLEMMLSNPSKQ